MQTPVTLLVEKFRNGGNYFDWKYKSNKNAAFTESLLSGSDAFVSVCLDPSVANPTPKFYMKGFFLDSSVDTKIKSVPVFLFSLQRYEARETYISCFYAENYPELFNAFNSRSFKEKFFLFNWFDHNALVPNRPSHQDVISNIFYYNEGKFFDYRVFDSTMWESSVNERYIYSNYFRASDCPKNRFIKRNRFYKRKYDWFLKRYA